MTPERKAEIIARVLQALEVALATKGPLTREKTKQIARDHRISPVNLIHALEAHRELTN